MATSYWEPYDDRMPWGRQDRAQDAIGAGIRDAGAKTVAVAADFTRPDAPAELFDAVERSLGSVTALVMAHCESVDSGILTTSIESFDRHFAVNTRASWLLIRDFARRFRGCRYRQDRRLNKRRHGRQSAIWCQQGRSRSSRCRSGSRTGRTTHHLQRHQSWPDRHRLDERSDARRAHHRESAWPPRTRRRRGESGFLPVLTRR